MYGCDHTAVGCLTVSASRIGGGIEADAYRIGTGITASASRIGEGLKVSCGIVCDIGKSLYLRVAPVEIKWISTTEAVIYQVESNTSWEIV